jgi:hypothetical protein
MSLSTEECLDGLDKPFIAACNSHIAEIGWGRVGSCCRLVELEYYVDM